MAGVGDLNSGSDGFAEVQRNQPTGIVALVRVICCDDNLETLGSTPASKARRHCYRVVYPPDTWWRRLDASIADWAYRVRRSLSRVLVHSLEAVERVTRSQGNATRFYRTTISQVVVYARLGHPCSFRN